MATILLKDPHLGEEESFRAEELIYGRLSWQINQLCTIQFTKTMRGSERSLNFLSGRFCCSSVALFNKKLHQKN